MLSVTICAYTCAQNHYLDSLTEQLKKTTREDTFRVKALSSMAEYYGFVQADSGLLYAAQVLRLSEKLNYPIGKFLGYRGMFFSFNCQGNYPKALEAALNIQKLGEIAKGDKDKGPTFPYYFLGLLNLEMRDYTKAKDFFYQAIASQRKNHQPQFDIYFVYSHMANPYRILNQKDSAMWYATRGYELGLHSKQDVQRYFCAGLQRTGKGLPEVTKI